MCDHGFRFKGNTGKKWSTPICWHGVFLIFVNLKLKMWSVKLKSERFEFIWSKSKLYLRSQCDWMFNWTELVHYVQIFWDVPVFSGFFYFEKLPLVYSQRKVEWLKKLLAGYFIRKIFDHVLYQTFCLLKSWIFVLLTLKMGTCFRFSDILLTLRQCIESFLY